MGEISRCDGQSYVQESGAEVSVLLRANAVNYAVKGQDASGLTFGSAALSVPPTLDRDIEDLLKARVQVYAVSEDLAQRGIATTELVGGVKAVGRHEMVALFDQHDQVWHW